MAPAKKARQYVAAKRYEKLPYFYMKSNSLTSPEILDKAKNYDQ
jgi:hypothetical protein